MGKRTAALTLSCSALALAAIGTGCTSSQMKQQRAAEARDAEVRFELGPLVDAEGTHRSLSLDSPAMRDLYQFQPWLNDRVSWYDDRLDRRASVAAGSRRTVVTFSETTVRDKFSSSNGKVQDNYSQSITRDKFFEVTR